MLYVVFGFLEWYESDDSHQPHFAPLVVLPVAVERAGGKGKAVETVVEYSGEDIESNLSLAEKMRRDFGVEIPFLEDDDTPETYFEKFQEILRVRKRWAIRRQITLALLSFGKLLMYRDLDPKTWPSGQSVATHPLVRELFEGSKHSDVTLAEEYSIDAPELKKDVPHLILNADSSQHSALVHALRGQNLVIEGPPGTGKSQTITNLIAAALAKGKSVLFVSEKLAALEVVRRRLDKAGLGIFCLEVHSHKTKKGALINDLAQRHQVRGSFKDPRDLDRQLAIVEEKKTLLTQYAELVNRTIEPFKATVFEILWARDFRATFRNLTEGLNDKQTGGGHRSACFFFALRGKDGGGSLLRTAARSSGVHAGCHCSPLSEAIVDWKSRPAGRTLAKYSPFFSAARRQETR